MTTAEKSKERLGRHTSLTKDRRPLTAEQSSSDQMTTLIVIGFMVLLFIAMITFVVMFGEPVESEPVDPWIML